MALRLTLLGIAAYLLSLLWTFPAGVAYEAISGSLPPAASELRLGGLSGSVWHGQAATVAYRDRTLGTLRWRLRPWSLLGGEFAVELWLQSEGGYLQGSVSSTSDGSLSLEALKGQLPIAEIQRLFPYQPVALAGLLSLDIDTLELSPGGVATAADGHIIVHRLKLLAPQQVAFGDYELEVGTGEEGVIEAQAVTLQTPLQLDAQATLEQGKHYMLKATVSAATSAPPELEQLLSLLGRADNGGRRQISLSGNLFP